MSTFINEKFETFPKLWEVLNTKADKWFVRYFKQSVCVTYHIPGEISFHRVPLPYDAALRFYNILFDRLSVLNPVLYRRHDIGSFRDAGTFLGMHCSLRRLLRLYSDSSISPITKHYKTF